MKIEEMTNEEIVETLDKLKSYFDSPLFENNQNVVNALEVAVEAIESKEKLNKTPFDRVNKGQQYYIIDNDEIIVLRDNSRSDDKQYECSNYFNDKNFAKQVALHQLLYRKLLKFKLEREKDNIDSEPRFFINVGADNSPFVNGIFVSRTNCNGVYFNESSTAELALKKVVKPFLEEHPDFIWNL